MKERIVHEFSVEKKGKYILYWMQQSQRTIKNDALNLAIERGNALGLPVLVVFISLPDFPGANERHFSFMLQGIENVEANLKSKGIGFRYSFGKIEVELEKYLDDAQEFIMDKGYLKIQKKWRDNIKSLVASKYPMNTYMVESDVLVPLEIASTKEEYSARTLRTKINKHKDFFLVEEDDLLPKVLWSDTLVKIGEVGLSSEDIISRMNFKDNVGESKYFKGGENAAYQVLDDFLKNKFQHYLLRNHPEYDYMSSMSPYLHFGQISVVDIINRARDEFFIRDDISQEAYDSFFDELIVRRELAMNFVYYNEKYDQFEGITYPWAYETMANHIDDPREYIYSLDEFEKCQTHDIYWNASMKELVETGKMHTYMRMYWCKKIIEWTKNYEEAYNISIYLNNKYNIDGRDANSYAGIAWCFGKHDRAWKEREVFGKLRYMNANGLNRKFEMEEYLEKTKNYTGAE
ncbi:MAG: deoxyribodipyrimidine photo-lyase [Firmicutes bacterium]|jgi:deoxyribodipyrimidine photo-lyase|nr:deoxyribodipyrimidine photo-lyase [Bacillota bacterium]